MSGSSHEVAAANKDMALYDSEESGSKLMRSLKKDPIVGVGLAGGLGVLGYMMYGLKTKPADQKLSVYLIHTRLGVQGTVIGAFALGMIAMIYQNQVKPRWEQHQAKKHPEE